MAEGDEAERLLREQQRRAETERELAGDSPDEAEARAHARRAEKADYLKSKLQERETSEEELAEGEPAEGKHE